MNDIINVLVGGAIYGLAFVVGSLPSGFWVAYLCGIDDIRQHGSGNIGASNVSRLLGWHYFALVLLLDAGKAFLFCYVMQKLELFSYFTGSFIYVPILGLLLGNIRSILLQGKGGKGVATAFGILLAFVPLYALIFALLWLLLVSMFRSAGIASLVSIWAVVLVEVCFPCAVFAGNAFSSALGCMAVLVTYSHRKNIEQLCKQWGIA